MLILILNSSQMCSSLPFPPLCCAAATYTALPQSRPPVCYRHTAIRALLPLYGYSPPTYLQDPIQVSPLSDSPLPQPLSVTFNFLRSLFWLLPIMVLQRGWGGTVFCSLSLRGLNYSGGFGHHLFSDSQTWHLNQLSLELGAPFPGTLR